MARSCTFKSRVSQGHAIWKNEVRKTGDFFGFDHCQSRKPQNIGKFISAKILEAFRFEPELLGGNASFVSHSPLTVDK